MLEQEVTNMKLKVVAEGMTEGLKVKGFFDGMGDLPLAQKMEIYNQLQFKQRLDTVTTNLQGQLFMAPEQLGVIRNVITLENDPAQVLENEQEKQLAPKKRSDASSSSVNVRDNAPKLMVNLTKAT